MATAQRSNLENFLDDVLVILTTVWEAIKQTYLFAAKAFGYRDAGFLFIGVGVVVFIIAQRSMYYYSQGVGRTDIKPHPSAFISSVVGFIVGVVAALSFTMGLVALAQWLMQPA